MAKVKLAIRIRPFTEKELKSEKERVAVVSLRDEQTVTITNIKVNTSGAGDSRERVRPYYADFIFDGAGHNKEYATQEKVFETIGQGVLTSISQGLSACVLAYGQSATGKTHTMMGTDSKPGLIPRLCRALGDEQTFDIKVSFLEIYNERVHDLLVSDVGTAPNSFSSLPRRKGNARKDLRVREHPTKGPYVQNLRRVCVRDVSALLSLVSEGASRRRSAATRRNPASSRSHALLELSTPRATVHLADLAGSEKASWEGCGGGRQKEGANINKSLVALSNVISALDPLIWSYLREHDKYEICRKITKENLFSLYLYLNKMIRERFVCVINGGNGRTRFVPYRDSALTWLLKDCFTGGGSIFLIATVSPSAACYGESASTLRWAAQARRLQTPKTSSATGVITRTALQAQLCQLVSELNRHHIRYIPESGKISYDDDHWKLIPKNKNNEVDNSKIEIQKTAKIGNNMNTTLPKTDVQNSESTNSSVASGSSDIINTMDKNTKVTYEINKEIDKLFGPTLERTKSGSVLEITTPLTHKKRQFCSQEVLPIDLSLRGQNDDQLSNVTHNLSNQKSDEKQYCMENKGPLVPIIHDNQRAEIIASVTERLYSKFKKDATINKMESLVDKKVTQPLSELRICTNARQRLVELSQKAIRNRRRIGIPAHTQTRRVVIRVKDQGINVQTDLAPFLIQKNNTRKFYRDVATETIPITPRCKEVAVGDGSLNYCDKSTTMELKKIAKKNTYVMTDIILKNSIYTQTQVLPPQRRKKRASGSKLCKKRNDIKQINAENCVTPSVININISPVYSFDSDSLSASVSSENESTENIGTTPDLLTNHNTDTAVPSKLNVNEVDENSIKDDNLPTIQFYDKTIEDFPEDDLPLPRVTVDASKVRDRDDIKNLILGRNLNVYPYNIELSPSKHKETKRVIKFEDSECDYIRKPNYYNDCIRRHNIRDSETLSDTSDSTKVGSETFMSKDDNMRNYNKSFTYPNKCYTSHKCCNKINTERNVKDYNNFLEADHDIDIDTSNPLKENFRSRKDKYWTREPTSSKFGAKHKTIKEDRNYGHFKSDSFENIESKIIETCNSLEQATSKYENYLDNYYKERQIKSPTEYMHYLVNLRREVVKESLSTCSTETISSDYRDVSTL